MKPDRERPPLIIRPGVSRRLRLIVLGLYGLTLPVVLLLPLAWPWRTLLVATLLIGLVGSLGGAVGHRWPWAPRQAIWHAEGHWTLTLGDGRELPARLLATTYVTPALLILNFRLGTGEGGASPRGLASWGRAIAHPATLLPWSIRSLVLLPDNLDPDLLRRLRVRLRLEGYPGRGQEPGAEGGRSTLGPG
jgi:toxin CptA